MWLLYNNGSFVKQKKGGIIKIGSQKCYVTRNNLTSTLSWIIASINARHSIAKLLKGAFGDVNCFLSATLIKSTWTYVRTVFLFWVENQPNLEWARYVYNVETLGQKFDDPCNPVHTKAGFVPVHSGNLTLLFHFYIFFVISFNFFFFWPIDRRRGKTVVQFATTKLEPRHFTW